MRRWRSWFPQFILARLLVDPILLDEALKEAVHILASRLTRLETVAALYCRRSSSGMANDGSGQGQSEGNSWRSC